MTSWTNTEDTAQNWAVAVMDIVEKNYAVYHRNLKKGAMDIWLEDLNNYSADDIDEAFKRHRRGESDHKEGNRSATLPNPQDIRTILRKIKAERAPKGPTVAEQNVDCDPKVWKAWFLFMRIRNGYYQDSKGDKVTLPLPGRDRHPNVQLTYDQVLDIVNQQAITPIPISDSHGLPVYKDGKRLCLAPCETHPECVPPEYRFSQYKTRYSDYQQLNP